MACPEDEKPIVSLLADDPSERPRIEAFVLGLGESVDVLQDLEQETNFGHVAERANGLARDAEIYGFPPLSQAAASVASAATALDAKRTRDTLLDLTEIARRVRLGHRGAAPL